MVKSTMLTGIIAGLFMVVSISPAQGENGTEKIPAPKIKEEINTVSVSGRLSLKPCAKEDALILNAKDAKSYIIQGKLVEQLKGVVLNLGEENLVSVTGTLNGAYDIACHNSYRFGVDGNRTVTTECIRYHHLNVTQINDATKSAEEMPPPERDSAEEAIARQSALLHSQQQSLRQMQMGEIKGKIRALNLKSPIKTVEVSFRDKDNRVINRVFLLTSSTRVAKKNLDTQEPMYLSVNSLQAGQEVTVVYIRDERKAEALFITITRN